MCTQEEVSKQLEDGVTIIDTERGNGKKKAKIGDIVSVFYENKLASNENIVGRKQNEDGIRFILGDIASEKSIIRGWHIGIIGMRKGGKRRITCPPNVAYGENGVSLFIPPNATIISEIQLLSIERCSNKSEL